MWASHRVHRVHRTSPGGGWMCENIYSITLPTLQSLPSAPSPNPTLLQSQNVQGRCRP
ncbi:hypothetical protein BDP27DRAFT_1331889 [Rhodocollybia butyracea]|uniref:Uncharacterized protein n=1 Tax=Rhodocollybia butyracea TaxID=206335 RepID=A0A9P5PLM1_9AGAR|nr:hypothetical protein BDP27DRAFT_1331889 [Rhodocollybia butyracea]